MPYARQSTKSLVHVRVMYVPTYGSCRFFVLSKNMIKRTVFDEWKKSRAKQKNGCAEMRD